MYRIINTQIWSDSWFFDLSPEQKLLFLYLCSSPYTSQLGMYKATVKHIEMETGLNNIEEILKSLFPKIIYIKELNLILIRNFLKYQNSGGIKFEKSVYQKFLEEPINIQTILLREIEFLKEIIKKFNKDLYEDRVSNIENTPNIHYRYPINSVSKDKYTLSIPHEYTIDTLSMGYPTESDTETESESDTETESDNIETSLGHITSTNVDEQDAQIEKTQNPLIKRQKNTKTKKYPEVVINFVEKFREYRENFLKIPITHKDWHLKTYAVTQKLLKKYSFAELEEALQDLKTQAWEDKASKIYEIWHFEDWLPRWKIWKYPPTSSYSQHSQKDDKYRRMYYEIYGKYPEEM